MKKDKGFISWLVLIIIALALLKYFFGWSIFDAASTEQGRGTIAYIKDVLSFVWYYLKVPVLFLWRIIFDLLPSR
ncbi:MAG: hypothetical protein Q7R69_02705 [bacterium]|nr:hypothetical protein [bacterium]